MVWISPNMQCSRYGKVVSAFYVLSQTYLQVGSNTHGTSISPMVKQIWSFSFENCLRYFINTTVYRLDQYQSSSPPKQNFATAIQEDQSYSGGHERRLLIMRSRVPIPALSLSILKKSLCLHSTIITHSAFPLKTLIPVGSQVARGLILI